MSAGTAIVTGSNGAIGGALARHLLGRGWTVLGVGRADSRLEAPGFHYFRADLTSEQEVLAFCGKAQGLFPRLDALVQCAATATMNHLLTTPAESVKDILALNVGAVFLLAREAAKWMGEGGRIVNLSSAALARNLEGESAYLASKAAVETLTRVHARELAPLGITVNCIAPPVFEGGLVAGVPEHKLREVLRLQAFPRACRAEDVANALDFFLCEESSMITGQVLGLGGLL